MAQPVYGVNGDADLQPHLISRETRPLLYRLNDFLAEAGGFVMILAGIIQILISWLPFPKVGDVFCVFTLVFIWYARNRYRKFLFRSPPEVQGGKANLEENDGLFILGNSLSNGASAWFSNSDMRSHMLVFGTTGSGKTVFLLGLFYQALLVGSGVMFVDGKADNTVFWMVYALCRRLGREDDLLVINYLTGGAASDRHSKSLERLSNTTNPFAYGSSEQLRSLVVGLMRDSGGDGDMWKGRASSMLGSLLKVLCHMRDREEIILNVMKISEYLPLEKISQLSQQNYPDHILAPIRKYLVTLPGYTEEDAIMGNIHEKAIEQHGYLTMQLTEVLGDLSDTYGHIFADPLGEVDFKDVVFNRRILFVMLPSLEADPDRLAGLGKMVVAGIRSALAPALGSELEGERTEVIERKPTNAKVPFLLILDEYGYYSVTGFAVVAAQARSLGVACIFAGQDYPSFKKGNDDEAASTVANTNIKVILKLEDASETFKLVEERGGESDVSLAHGFERNGSGYVDQGQTRIDRRKRINLRDLVSQNAGEGHIIYGDKIERCKLYYAAPDDISRRLKAAKLNKFIQVPRPSSEHIARLKGSYDRIVGLESGKALPVKSIGNKRRLVSGPRGVDPNIHILISDYALARKQHQSPTEAAMLAVGMQELRARVMDAKIEESAAAVMATEVKAKMPGTETGMDAHEELPADLISFEGEPPVEILPLELSDVDFSMDALESAMEELGMNVSTQPSNDVELAVVTDADFELSLRLLDDDAAPQSSQKERAIQIEADFAETLTAVLLERAQKLAGRPLSEQEKREINPVNQLVSLELENGADVDVAKAEAGRAVEILSKKITYPTRPTPQMRDLQTIRGDISSMIKAIAKAEQGGKLADSDQ